ncbi:hypothetical protein ACQJBY_066068 [Aegilops geniculata]
MRSRGFSLCVASPRPAAVLLRPASRPARARGPPPPPRPPSPRRRPLEWSTRRLALPVTTSLYKSICRATPASLPMNLSDARELPALEIEIVAVFPTAGKSCLLPRLTCSETRR